MFEKLNYLLEAKRTLNTVLNEIEPGLYQDGRNFTNAQRLVLMRADALLSLMAYRQLPQINLTLEEARLLYSYLNSLSAKRYRCGCCSEISEACYIELIERGIAPVELFHLEGGDHCLVLVGRCDLDVSISESEAVVLDAWAEEVYPIADFQKKQQAVAIRKTVPDAQKVSERVNYLEGKLTIKTPRLNPSELLRFQEIRK